MSDMTVKQLKEVKNCLEKFLTPEEITLLINEFIDSELDLAVARLVGAVDRKVSQNEINLEKASTIYRELGIEVKDLFKLRQAKTR